jgi:hypothetical protein
VQLAQSRKQPAVEQLQGWFFKKKSVKKRNSVRRLVRSHLTGAKRRWCVLTGEGLRYGEGTEDTIGVILYSDVLSCERLNEGFCMTLLNGDMYEMYPDKEVGEAKIKVGKWIAALDPKEEETILKEGWLLKIKEKEGRKGVGKRRWVKLTSQSLTYYGEQQRDVRGKIRLGEVRLYDEMMQIRDGPQIYYFADTLGGAPAAHWVQAYLRSSLKVI